MAAGDAIVSGLLVLIPVATYLGLVLPLLSLRRALAVSAGMVLLLLVVSAALTSLGPTAPLMGVAALVAGHCCWWLASRHRRRRFGGSKPSSTGPGRRSASSEKRPAVAPSSPRQHPEREATLAVAADAPPRVAPAVPSSATSANEPKPSAPSLPTVPVGGLPMADLQRTSLGRYRIDRAIGRGSMGAVFLGVDPMLGRQVAIKTMALGQEFAGAELVEAKQRFFREAETAGRLQHRDIVTIYDVGEEQDLAYIAMEFLKGHDLQRHTSAANLLPVPVVMRIGSRVADALAYAHAQGVVHRDVKPANVMLHLPTGAVKVTDFGIARVTDASRTRTGMVLGTPSFMSPEHLAGQRVDGRTDLYSLGVMLFQLLTGQLPFQADSMAKLMYRIANDPAPDLRSVRPDLPESLARLLAQALHKNPALRHSDGARMAAELKAVDTGEASPLWGGGAEAGPASGAADKDDPAKAFESTVRLGREQTRHNSAS